MIFNDITKNSRKEVCRTASKLHMSKKIKTVFICQECGYESPKWAGQCVCGAWNSLVEEKVSPIPSTKIGLNTPSNIKPTPISQIEVKGRGPRINTGINELNRVFGGGIVPGSLTLISGEPGIGKSTIIMQTANNIALSGKKVLYISGEESTGQLKLRWERICGEKSDNLFVLSETNIDNIARLVDEFSVEFLIIDSIQTMYTEDISSAPGSVSQVRSCGNLLMSIGKKKNVPVFIVAHVTKSGELAGPKVVEHLVDCVLHFSGERNKELRILRAYKNRFGTVSEIGAFQMEDEGLREVFNLSGTFLEDSESQKEGSIVGAVYEGTRPLLLEIQALTAYTNMAFPRRNAIGIDTNRLSMIIAVLERKCGLNLTNQDVYLNIVGGLKPAGTYTDLASALAIYSSFMNKTPKTDMPTVGEIGLTGSLRSVPHVDRIVKEAERMGFNKILIPASCKLPSKFPSLSIEILRANSLGNAIKKAF